MHGTQTVKPIDVGIAANAVGLRQSREFRL